MDQIVAKFKEWIRTSLSTPEAFLNGIPACPYARDAIVQRRFSMHVCSGDLETYLEERLLDYTVTGRESVIFVDQSKVGGPEFERAVLNLREKFFRKDVWPLYDHPDLPEIQGDMCFNFKASALVIVQSLSGLVEASRELHKRGYYANWTPEYYDQVVGRRERYNNRRLAEFQEAPSMDMA